MRLFTSLLMVILATFMLITTDAQAKRFGGGKSFGMQRNSQSYARPQSTQAAGGIASKASKWAAPLMGLAAGALLGSLLMNHGLGSAILSWLALAVLFMFIMALIRRFRHHGNQQQAAFHSANNMQSTNHQPQAPLSNQPNPFQRPQSPLNFAANSSGDQDAGYPIGFHADTFLRDAKSRFLRLQTAYDQKNLNDLRQFTTPEIFAEIQLQLQERGEDDNHTEVVSLESQLLDVSEAPQITLHGQVTVLTASVQFTGLIREAPNAAPAQINEIWHFQKDKMGTEWHVAGLQQA